MTRLALTAAVMVPAVGVWLTAWGLTAATDAVWRRVFAPCEFEWVEQ